MFYVFLFSVTIQACKGHSFKGFLIQPRLAQFATQDVKIDLFVKFVLIKALRMS